jgi:hypothetical protein
MVGVPGSGCGDFRGITLVEEHDATGQWCMTLPQGRVTAQVPDRASPSSAPPTIRPSLRDRSAKAKRTSVSGYSWFNPDIFAIGENPGPAML